MHHLFKVHFPLSTRWTPKRPLPLIPNEICLRMPAICSVYILLPDEDCVRPCVKKLYYDVFILTRCIMGEVGSVPQTRVALSSPNSESWGLKKEFYFTYLILCTCIHDHFGLLAFFLVLCFLSLQKLPFLFLLVSSPLQCLPCSISFQPFISCCIIIFVSPPRASLPPFSFLHYHVIFALSFCYFRYIVLVFFSLAFRRLLISLLFSLCSILVCLPLFPFVFFLSFPLLSFVLALLPYLFVIWQCALHSSFVSRLSPKRFPYLPAVR